MRLTGCLTQLNFCTLVNVVLMMRVREIICPFSSAQMMGNAALTDRQNSRYSENQCKQSSLSGWRVLLSFGCHMCFGKLRTKVFAWQICLAALSVAVIRCFCYG